MFLSIFIHFNLHFKRLTQSFYIALSHINIRTRNKRSAGVLVIRGRKISAGVIIRAGGASQKFLKFFRKSLSAENCRTVPKKPYSIS